MTHCEVIIVIWRWPGSKKVEKYQISGSSNRYLYTVYFDSVDLSTNEERQKRTHQDLMAIFDELASSEIPVRFLLLVHEVQTFDFKQLNDFLNARLAEVTVRKFSGGAGFIYFDAKYETGLINPQSGLVKDVKYAVTADGKREKRGFTIFDQEGFIKEKSFIGVWKFYSFLIKTQLFEAHEMILCQIPDLLISSPSTLRQFAQKENIAKLNTFFDNFTPKRSAEIETYISERVANKELPQKTLECYRALFLQLGQPMNTPGFFPRLSEKFIELIDLFPEPIY